MSETICPFCQRDPFHYVDNGVGMEAVAVTCCDLGDQLFRGRRPAPEEVTMSWDEFVEIANRLRPSQPEPAAQAVTEEYQPRTRERLVEILRAHDQNPRSWQQEAAAMLVFPQAEKSEAGQTYGVDYDGFVGTHQGDYITREGKPGVVLQQVGTKVVHVYGRNRISPITSGGGDAG